MSSCLPRAAVVSFFTTDACEFTLKYLLVGVGEAPLPLLSDRVDSCLPNADDAESSFETAPLPLFTLSVRRTDIDEFEYC